MSISVSVITPTANRRKFIPYLIEMYKAQTYAKNRMEWIILDDGEDSVEDLFKQASKTIPNIRYIREKEKQLIGRKRNRLNDEANGSIIIAMDDDDYYPPCRVQHVLDNFQRYKDIELAGSSKMYMFFTYDKKIFEIGPYNPRHATNGTMAWRKSYSDKHRYDETVPFGEEKSYLENYIHSMIQLDPMKVMLVISHSSNTFDKMKLRQQNNPLLKETNLKMREFIKEPKLREFFTNA
jgi:glycosyltransferase involved in cell wall biosynthesis